MAFILDTNIFLQAKNKDYPFTYFPGFWEWLDSGFKTRQFLLLSSVYKEVSGGDDEVSDWIKSRKQYVIKEEKAKNYMKNHKKIVNFLNGKGFTHMNDFLQKADGSLIAYAMTSGDMVITHELPRPDSKKHPKIPDVCNQFGVKWKGLLYLFANSTPKPIFTLSSPYP